MQIAVGRLFLAILGGIELTFTESPKHEFKKKCSYAVETVDHKDRYEEKFYHYY